MSTQPDDLEPLIRRLEALVQLVRSMRIDRKLREFPPGHPEEPAALKAWREQNPEHEEPQD